ncbi:hypothetical protein IPC1008_25655 [Pseudomonas aeruginosa]|uniref:hypothetical protein n=1 Tax=Pseudomonas aeruginosa TaxID=287 RepID=UPI000F51E8DE|nr:hypothetical protein [Pseudomonas aeruginosa]RPS37631.1 hypothetical protein IPC1008_25655 [Pseudomonas aeruginosa]
MAIEGKILSNPFSTGSGGARFEANIQATFVTLMLSGGYSPCLPNWPIVEIKLQGKVAGFETDDLIVYVENPSTQECCKLLGQVKHSIGVTEGDSVFQEVIQAAWIDFNNPEIFRKGVDVIALITGPISATDSDGVSGLLEQAQRCKDSEEFITNVSRARFCSETVRRKLKAFRVQLKRANNGIDLSDGEIFDFLRSFHLLGYDLSRKGSVVSSLLQSHISQFNKDIPDKIWYHIINEVQAFNQAAGTITKSSLGSEVVGYFEEPKLTYIPSELLWDEAQVQVERIETSVDWKTHPAAAFIAQANLLGAWNEASADDLRVVEEFVKEPYVKWIEKLRDVLWIEGSPLTHRDGIWAIKDRERCWIDFGFRVFDDHLESMADVCKAVLEVNDPALDLPADDRYAAAIHGKVLPYTNDLREGLAGTLALLGTKAGALSNCRKGKAGSIVEEVVYFLLGNADWVRWASLSELAPTLAEASPNAFLSAVEEATARQDSPYLELFSQEAGGVFGRNYMVGVLWALEALAWDEELLIRATVALAEIAAIDPGGNWGNRAKNSLTDIFLPWLPHTLGSSEKRKIALKTISREQPKVCRKLLGSLIPNQQQSTSGTFKSVWRLKVDECWNKKIGHAEYIEQSNYCSELLVELAGWDSGALSDLVNKYANLPANARDLLLERLSSKDFTSKPELERYEAWQAAWNLLRHHRRFPEASWSMPEELLSPLECVADKIKPESAVLRNKELFSSNDYYLLDHSLDSDQQREKLDAARGVALETILAEGGFDCVIEFSTTVANPQTVGQALATIDGINFDGAIFPALLSESGKLNKFVSGYAWYKRWRKGWQWFDDLDKCSFSPDNLVSLLCMLPFSKDTWVRAEQLLGDLQSRYWLSVQPSVFQMDSDFDYAVEKLLEVGRAGAALEAYASELFNKRDIDPNLACRALISFGTTGGDSKRVDAYRISEIIKNLQGHAAVDKVELGRVEWMYIGLLDSHNEVRPVTLEKNLASSPAFFCELVRAVYAPKHRPEETDATVVDSNVALNAYRLLQRWSLVPGVKEDGSFCSEEFRCWLAEVDKLSNETGHHDMAMSCLGSVLINAPTTDDLWMAPVIAEVLNEKDRDSLREGYAISLFNSRGAHWVDPEGKPEKELAEKYRQQAMLMETGGFQRFSRTLLDIAEDYERQAERHIARFGKTDH